MGFSCGIVGLPNVGKSTIFRALTSADVTIEPYAFSTITPNIGVADVPDVRLEHIALSIKPDSIVKTTLNFVDVAGLVEGASLGEGMGNQFLSHIRDVDVIAHVVRCFQDENIPHITPELNPLKDIEVIELELILKDLDTIDKRIDKLQKASKSGNKEALRNLDILERIRIELNEGTPVSSLRLEEPEHAFLDQLYLLSAKPQFFVANIGEEQLKTDDDPLLEQVSEAAIARGIPFISLCSKLEAEILDLPSEERHLFSEEMGIVESGLEILVSVGYELLELITFFTTQSNEVKAWTVTDGTSAAEAAGKIHSDIQSGFIKADIIKYEDLIDFQSESAVRDKGLVMTVGKEHFVEDGDIIHFKFRS
ncbi:MAG: redox-regulated ATPase YchF [Candidatus Marinimicrobia bacterium]|nr:redox-regulated ATPase YchF [Candidatus Neomarinimicrobiota bacterium]